MRKTEAGLLGKGILYYKNSSNTIHETELTVRKFFIFVFIATIQWITETNILNNQVTKYGDVCSTRYDFCIGTVFSSCLLVPMILQFIKILIDFWQTKWSLDFLTFFKFCTIFSELGLTIMTVWSSFIIVSSSETILDLVLNCGALEVIRELDATILKFVGVPLKNDRASASRLTETLQLDIEQYDEWFWKPEIWYFLLSALVYGSTLLAWLQCYDYFD